ncbi:MAG: Two component system histidine kinase [Microbacteriaceae bacterium]|nr:Two component system histidine kinase [Microbacteriaceae bacterium]
MSGWFGSLRGRITLVTVSVAVLAVLVTGLISLQLVRSSTVGEAKQQLSSQATLLARVPGATAAELTDRLSLALGDTEVAVVSADGSISGPAAKYVGPAMVRRLLADRPLSVVVRKFGTPTLIEARPARGGGAVVLIRSEDSLEQATHGSAQRILWALAIGIVVAIVAGALLGRWLGRPLVTTAATARRMAAGERGLPLTAHRPTEIADVADALATLDEALTTSEGRQREFLLSISHELRTPLTALRGYGEALADGLIGEHDTAAVGATLVAETERLDRFVADLLELARLEADDFVIHTQQFSASVLLVQVQNAWQGRCTTLGVTIEIAGDAVFTTDEQRLRQVLDGLVENALRVSPAGSTVTVTAAPGRVVVEDHGPGLAASDLDVAFDRGILNARYANARPVGTGLGLSIAARLVSRLGGTITAASDPGGGARFTVSLP